MTDTTQPIAQLRHLYQNMVNGGVQNADSAKRIAEGLLGPAIAALEAHAQKLAAIEHAAGDMSKNGRESNMAQAPAVPAVPDGWRAGVEAVAAMLTKKADDYAAEYGYDDMGGLSFGRGGLADARLDHHSNLVELADEVRAMLTAAPQPEPQAPAVPAVSDAMVGAYLQAQRHAVEEADKFGRPNIGGLHTNTVREACRAGLIAALTAAPQPSAQAVPDCLTCNDHGAVGNILTAEPCPDCTSAPQPEAEARAVPVVPSAGVPSQTFAPRLLAMASNYADGHAWDKLDGYTCRGAAQEIAALRTMLAAAPQSEAQAAQAVRRGWKLVPVEPTIDQEWAGKQAALRGSTMAEACKIYKAMLAAAPKFWTPEQIEAARESAKRFDHWVHQAPQQAAPAEWKLVPPEITSEMTDAWQTAFGRQLQKRVNSRGRLKSAAHFKKSCEEVAYVAMLAAAPKAPQQAAPAGPSYTVEEMRRARRESYEQGAASTVPQKVTPAMRAAFREAYKNGSMWTDRLDRAVEAMIAAAPQQQDVQYDHGPQAEAVAEAARDVGKWLNERPNRPLDLRHVAMLAHHATAQPAPSGDARALFDAGWKACARFCNREDAIFDGIVGNTGCPEFEAAWDAARKEGKP